MEKLSMCRICLSKDIQIQFVTNTHLQEMYQILTAMPFETDNRPLQICYICCARLENCCRLRRHCLWSEELFTQMLKNNMLMPPSLRENPHKNHLDITSVIHLSIGHVEQKQTNCIVKLEPSEVLTNIEVKLEELEGDHVPLNTIKPNSEVTTFSNTKENVNAVVKIEKIEDNDYSETISEETVVYNDENVNEQPLICKNSKDTTSINEPSLDISITKTSISKDKPFRCDICQKSFIYKCHLDVHSRSHTGTKPFRCNICTKCFSQKSNLKSHIRTHTGEKPHQCDECKKCFSNKSSLINHKYTHTVKKMYRSKLFKKCFTEESNPENPTQTITEEKPYQCEVCKTCFSRKQNLSRHFLIHTGEKPYQCEVCQKRFSTKRNLSSHFFTHTGEKNYECNLCKRRFVHKNDLIHHMRIHTGEKPYQCEVCKTCFSRKQNLARHFFTHTSEKSYQ